MIPALRGSQVRTCADDRETVKPHRKHTARHERRDSPGVDDYDLDPTGTRSDGHLER